MSGLEPAEGGEGGPGAALQFGNSGGVSEEGRQGHHLPVLAFVTEADGVDFGGRDLAREEMRGAGGVHHRGEFALPEQAGGGGVGGYERVMSQVETGCFCVYLQ